MKREDILAMPAGRELDAFIAEKVMGWKRGYGITWITGRSKTGGILQAHHIRPYSTNISAAWEVVEKTEGKCRLSLHRTLTQGGWQAVFWDNMTDTTISAVGKTAPEAICKAALIAVLEESL